MARVLRAWDARRGSFTLEHPVDTSDLLNQHSRLTADLAAALRDLGQTRATIARRQATAWQETTYLSITERREEVRHAVTDLTADLEQQLGEVEALRAELANLTLLITYGNA